MRVSAGSRGTDWLRPCQPCCSKPAFFLRCAHLIISAGPVTSSHREGGCRFSAVLLQLLCIPSAVAPLQYRYTSLHRCGYTGQVPILQLSLVILHCPTTRQPTCCKCTLPLKVISSSVAAPRLIIPERPAISDRTPLFTTYLHLSPTQSHSPQFHLDLAFSQTPTWALKHRHSTLMDASSSFTAPTSFRLLRLAQDAYEMPLRVMENPSESHPSLSHLCLLVFEAVLEVVCVSLPGYIVARLGHFDADKQKFLANLNVMLFTPCLSKSSFSALPFCLFLFYVADL